MAIVATIAAAAAAAAIPYVIEGGKKLYSEYGAADIPQDALDFSAERAEGNRLQSMQEQGLQEQIQQAEGITGAAIGGSLASQQGTGLMSLSGVNMAQAQQGEVLAQKQIGGLKQDLLNVQVSRHNDLMSQADQNIDNILKQHRFSKQRNQALTALSNATGITPAERSRYLAAAAQYPA
jgi:hypothetical protein